MLVLNSYTSFQISGCTGYTLLLENHTKSCCMRFHGLDVNRWRSPCWHYYQTISAPLHPDGGSRSSVVARWAAEQRVEQSIPLWGNVSSQNSSHSPRLSLAQFSLHSAKQWPKTPFIHSFIHAGNMVFIVLLYVGSVVVQVVWTLSFRICQMLVCMTKIFEIIFLEITLRT